MTSQRARRRWRNDGRSTVNGVDNATISMWSGWQKLTEAPARTKASSVDGVTAQESEAQLRVNLESLLESFKTGNYQAPPVRRVHIPKESAEGKTRPLGIPSLEERVSPAGCFDGAGIDIRAGLFRLFLRFPAACGEAA
jgi:hypothetical protein